MLSNKAFLICLSVISLRIYNSIQYCSWEQDNDLWPGVFTVTLAMTSAPNRAAITTWEDGLWALVIPCLQAKSVEDVGCTSYLLCRDNLPCLSQTVLGFVFLLFSVLFYFFFFPAFLIFIYLSLAFSSFVCLLLFCIICTLSPYYHIYRHAYFHK